MLGIQSFMLVRHCQLNSISSCRFDRPSAMLSPPGNGVFIPLKCPPLLCRHSQPQGTSDEPSLKMTWKLWFVCSFCFFYRIIPLWLVSYSTALFWEQQIYVFCVCGVGDGLCRPCTCFATLTLCLWTVFPEPHLPSRVSAWSLQRGHYANDVARDNIW